MSLREGPRKVVLWPHYFDAERSWSRGRRVPRSLAVRRPDLEEVAEAARRAGYECIVDGEARHPATWFEYRGRVLVVTDERKTTVLRRVAKELKALRK